MVQLKIVMSVQRSCSLILDELSDWLFLISFGIRISSQQQMQGPFEFQKNHVARGMNTT